MSGDVGGVGCMGGDSIIMFSAGFDEDPDEDGG
jgi:hypothetical protein